MTVVVFKPYQHVNNGNGQFDYELFASKI